MFLRLKKSSRGESRLWCHDLFRLLSASTALCFHRVDRNQMTINISRAFYLLMLPLCREVNIIGIFLFNSDRKNCFTNHNFLLTQIINTNEKFTWLAKGKVLHSIWCHSSNVWDSKQMNKECEVLRTHSSKLDEVQRTLYCTSRKAVVVWY